MKYQKIKILLAVVAMLATVITTACPKSKTDALRSAIEASYRLPAATNDIIRDVADARDRGIITVEQARKFGDALNSVARAEVTFVAMVKAANEVFKTTGKIDPATQTNLRNFFDLNIIGPFLTVLETAKLLSGPQVSLILLAITAARLLIKTIASGIGSKKPNALTGPDGNAVILFPARSVNHAG